MKLYNYLNEKTISDKLKEEIRINCSDFLKNKKSNLYRRNR